jgi:type II secretory pathway component GspD/PulD (secretin)
MGSDQVYEVSGASERNTGVILPNSATVYNVESEANTILTNNASAVQQIISSGLASQGDTSAILAILIASGYVTGSVFNSPSVVFGGGLTETGMEWNSTSVNLLLTSSAATSLQQVRLVGVENQECTFRLGERYPIMSSSYTTSSSTSSSTTTIPQIQYQDLGLTLKVTPWLGNGEHVGLDFDFTLRSLSGSSINRIPVMSNRRTSGLVTLQCLRENSRRYL